MIEPALEPGTGADMVTKSSFQQLEVRWPTRLRIALHVAVERVAPGSEFLDDLAP